MKNLSPILLVEDDQVDVMTVKRSFKDLKVANELVVTSNGEEALEYLENPQTQRPCVILLDINMPRMNGLEFLKQFRRYHGIKQIPVVMITSSQEQQDVNRCVEMGIAGYILKSVEYHQFLKSIQILDAYWTIIE